MTTCYRVSGGFAGYHNPAADETTREATFDERFESLPDAMNRARAICADLCPGGMVMVDEWDDSPEGMPSLEREVFAYAERYLSPAVGDNGWYVSGTDLR